MADGIYVGMTGAVARAEQLDAIADNLANLETPGYKATRSAFMVFDNGAPGNDKAYTAAIATGTDPRQGRIITTDQNLDAIPDDNAYFAVQRENGSVQFTRFGHITADAQGILRIGQNPVLGVNGQPIQVPPGKMVRLGNDGMVFSEKFEVMRIALFQLPKQLLREGGNLFSLPKGAQALQVDKPIRTGVLESSNTDALDSTVQMITAQRTYDATMQAIQTYRRLDDRANELGRLR